MLSVSLPTWLPPLLRYASAGRKRHRFPNLCACGLSRLCRAVQGPDKSLQRFFARPAIGKADDLIERDQVYVRLTPGQQLSKPPGIDLPIIDAAQENIFKCNLSTRCCKELISTLENGFEPNLVVRRHDLSSQRIR